MARGQRSFTQNGANQGNFQNFTLDQTRTDSLLFMIEEEKMARDIYDALFEQTGISTFDTISNSEQYSYDRMLSNALKFGVDTSKLSSDIGVYANTDIQALYDQLLVQVSASTVDTDITDLQNTIDSALITLIGQVQINCSANQLSGFQSIA
ncbi:MAG: DUF2202 domain-containing protein [Sulfurimonas sp.]|jgi:hypothetical protein|nr:DUF2202 domain-containing protein [Sulfurimonas sp.]